MASEIIERKMYADKYTLLHNPNARGRAPRYVLTDNETQVITKPKGVTTILGQTLAKDLMQWAVDCCLENLREKLPVITEADLLTAGDEYKNRRDSGASTGTEAHFMVENYLKGVRNEGKASLEALNAYRAFVEWFEMAQPEVLNVEEIIYSNKFEYAGTYDLMLKMDGKITLADYKTTNASRKAPNGIYAENLIQLGAYAAAHEEQRLYEEANCGTELLKIDELAVISGKKNGVLDYVTASSLGLTVEECGEAFTKVADLYKFLQETTAELGGK